jgi:hypothetical protein
VPHGRAEADLVPDPPGRGNAVSRAVELYEAVTEALEDDDS